MNVDLPQLLKLDPIEKLRIIMALEDSLTPREPVKFTAEQIEELRRRKREHELNPESAIGCEALDRYLETDDL